MTVVASRVKVQRNVPSRAKKNTVSFSLRGRKQRKEQVAEEKSAREILISSIKSTETQLKKAYCAFNEARDTDLVESCIFEIKSLHAKHNYLTKQLRSGEGVS